MFVLPELSYVTVDNLLPRIDSTRSLLADLIIFSIMLSARLPFAQWREPERGEHWPARRANEKAKKLIERERERRRRRRRRHIDRAKQAAVRGCTINERKWLLVTKD